MDLSRHNKLVFVTVTKQPVRNSWSPNLRKGNCVICQQIRAAELIRLADNSSHTRRQEDAAIQDVVGDKGIARQQPLPSYCVDSQLLIAAGIQS